MTALNLQYIATQEQVQMQRIRFALKFAVEESRRRKIIGNTLKFKLVRIMFVKIFISCE